MREEHMRESGCVKKLLSVIEFIHSLPSTFGLLKARLLAPVAAANQANAGERVLAHL